MSDIPSPAELRAELDRLIVTDLLGPTDPHESLPGVRSPVRERYLVGMLAPAATRPVPAGGRGARPVLSHADLLARQPLPRQRQERPDQADVARSALSSA